MGRPYLTSSDRSPDDIVGAMSTHESDYDAKVTGANFGSETRNKKVPPRDCFWSPSLRIDEQLVDDPVIVSPSKSHIRVSGRPGGLIAKVSSSDEKVSKK